MQPLGEGDRGPLTTYLWHLLIAWFGGAAATFLVDAALGNSPLARFSGQFDAPWFLDFIFVGLALGFWFNRRERSLVASLAFAPPLLLFFWNMHSVVYGGISPYNGWGYFYQQYFSQNCEATECLGEAVFTMPLYVTLAYSAAALAVALIGRIRART